MTKAQSVDFDSLDTAAACENPFELELVHPASKEPLGVFVSVLGPESAAFKNKVRKEVNRDRMLDFEAKRKSKDASPKRLEDDEAFGISLISDIVTGWRTVTKGVSEPVVIWKGEKLEFNPDNLTRWLTHFQWVRTQITEAQGDLGNFIKA